VNDGIIKMIVLFGIWQRVHIDEYIGQAVLPPEHVGVGQRNVGAVQPMLRFVISGDSGDNRKDATGSLSLSLE
jgi:hypothetical protein